MLLDGRLEAELEVFREGSAHGSHFYEASLVSDDGQTLWLYDGQLKEVACDELEIGARYKVVFRPFVNNRWLEFKVASLELIQPPPE